MDEEGEVREESVLEFKARIISHEMDHLDGINMFDNGLS